MAFASCQLLIAVVLVVSNVWAMDVFLKSFGEFKEDIVRTKKRDEKDQASAFTFAKIFQDHMVLQREPAKANVHGFAPSADIGSNVTVKMTTPSSTFNYDTTVVQGHTPDIGAWSVLLDPQQAGVIATISAQLENSSVIISDVIFGDVWICSGQSNMQFTVSMMEDNTAELNDADYPNIRLLTFAQQEATTPQYDIIQIQQNWTLATNASVGGPDWQYFSSVCWVFGKNIHKALNIPIGLIATTWRGTRVEAWSSPDALARCGITENVKVATPESHERALPEKEHHHLQRPNDLSVLWNGMIHPLFNSTIMGVIWYQGESNASNNRGKYSCTFPTLIEDWRANFNIGSHGQTSNMFPFGFVQLAPHNQNNNTVGYPDIRWHQTADIGYVPNSIMQKVFMAVTMDLPGYNSRYGSYHPQDKKDVGDRLSLAGLAVAYGKSETFQGPFPSKVEIVNQDLKITYAPEWTLDIRDSNGFELQCADNQWHSVPINTHDDTSISLRWAVCSTAGQVKALRYAWRESPCAFKKCAVYSKENSLPAPPFVRTASQVIDELPVFDFDKPGHLFT